MTHFQTIWENRGHSSLKETWEEGRVLCISSSCLQEGEMWKGETEASSEARCNRLQWNHLENLTYIPGVGATQSLTLNSHLKSLKLRGCAWTWQGRKCSAGEEHKRISPGLEWTLQIKPGHGLLSWNWPCPRGHSDKGEGTTAGRSYRWTFRCGSRVRVP